MVSWDYIRKRRGWTSESVLLSLDNRSWNSFVEFFELRGIEVPPKNEFESAKKLIEPSLKKPVVEIPVRKKKPIRRPTRKRTPKKGK